MNRRLFLKALAVSPIVPSVLCAKEKSQLTLAMLRKAHDELKALECDDETIWIPVDADSMVWKFYINDKEVDSSRAWGEKGGLHFPFDGARQGDECRMVSPRVQF